MRVAWVAAAKGVVLTKNSVSVSDELYWDPFDYDLQANPHPVWRRMREEAPLYRNDNYDFWALTRFDDVLNVLVDWKTYSSSKGDLLEVIRAPQSEFITDGLLFLDPPRHDMYRHLFSRTFTPRAVKRIEDRVRAFAQELLDERVGSGGFDFVDEYGAQIPAVVIAAMLGTPDSDVAEIRHLSEDQIAQASPPGDRELEEFDRTKNDEVTNRLGEYFMDQVKARRRNPTDDIVSALVAVEFTDEQGVTRKLTDLEACGQISLLSSAGNDTTARHIGWSGATLALYPDQRAKLAARPQLIANAVEEILRYEPPSMALARLVMEDVVWYDQVVPEGAVIVPIHAATGRDPRQFPDPDPDTLDVERRIDRHLSFGFGVHVCLGASLARLEGRIALEEMLKRFPEWDVEWDRTEIVHTGSAIRGYCKLPIRTG
jgi:cytochrome P450